VVLGRGLVGADEVRITVAKVLDNEDDGEIEREEDTLLDADEPWPEAEDTEELLELAEATELDDDAKVEEGIDSEEATELDEAAELDEQQNSKKLSQPNWLPESKRLHRSWKSNSKGSLRKKRTPTHMESRLGRKTDM
jgi:hypothetical protein